MSSTPESGAEPKPDPQSELVCHCFGHDRAALEAGQRADGSNAVIDAVTAACRAGRSRCKELNPTGRCCLGELRRLAKIAASADDRGPRGCCGDDDERP